MFVVRLFRWLCGYVSFTMSGVFLERFLNLAARDGINIWNLRRKGETVTGCVTVRGYKKFPRYAAKTRVRARHIQRFGMPFLTKRYRRRVGIAVGVTLFFVTLAVLSQFVWRVQINGCETIDPQTVRDAVEEFGLRPGVFKGSLDAREIENRVRIKLDTISWIAVNIQGSTAMVEIEERVMPPQMLDETPTNVIASHDGMITRVEAKDGQSLVQKGDAVQRGDLLISGIIESKSGKSIIKHAFGKVYALYEELITITIPLNQKQEVLGEVAKTRSSLRIGEVVLPLSMGNSPGSGYKVWVQESPVQLFGIALPFTYVKKSYAPISYREVMLTQNEAKGQALARLETIETEGIGECLHKEKSVTGAVNGDTYVLTARFVVEKDIAILEKLETDLPLGQENPS